MRRVSRLASARLENDNPTAFSSQSVRQQQTSNTAADDADVSGSPDLPILLLLKINKHSGFLGADPTGST
jgi:hypothetical protein